MDSWRYVHFVCMFKAGGILKFFCENLNFTLETLSTSTNNSWSPYLLAVRAEDMYISKYLLDKGVDVNTYSKTQGSALHIAVLRGN